MKTPIAFLQRRRATHLLAVAGGSLTALVEECLNLDPETQDAVNRARGQLSEAERLLIEQPDYKP